MPENKAQEGEEDGGSAKRGAVEPRTKQNASGRKEKP